MTGILEIPLGPLPIQAIVQLGMLNKEMYRLVKQEMLHRNVGLELYQYLSTLPEDDRIVKIETQLSSTLLWEIVQATVAYMNPPHNSYLMILPWLNGARITVNTVRLSNSVEYMLNVVSTIDLFKVVPSIVCGNDIIAWTIETAVEKLTNTFNNIVTNLTALPDNVAHTEDIAMDWQTSPITFYMLGLTKNEIYTLSPMRLHKHTRPNIDQLHTLLAYEHEANNQVGAIVCILLDARIYS
jgi:hypothetical protein